MFCPFLSTPETHADCDKDCMFYQAVTGQEHCRILEMCNDTDFLVSNSFAPDKSEE